MKIQGLVSDEITPAIDELLTSISNSENMSSEKLHEYLDKNAKDFFDKVEEDIVGQIVSNYGLNDLRGKYEGAKEVCDEIVKKNEEVFLFFHAYIEVARQVFSRFLKKISKTGIQASQLESKDFIFISFYGNLCRQADQICLILMNGYPDAALRLWRTFYEHCVVAVFLMKNNSNELADRFRDSTYKGQKKSVESYAKRYEYFNLPPLDEDFIKKTNKEFESIKNSYEKDFFENDYSWAKPFLNGKTSFGAVEEAVEMARYRPFYIWASGKVHPTFAEITDFRDDQGNIILDRMLKPNASQVMMIDPAQLTIGCFYEVNSYFLELYSGHEYEVNLMLFRKIWERFADALKKDGSTDQKE